MLQSNDTKRFINLRKITVSIYIIDFLVWFWSWNLFSYSEFTTNFWCRKFCIVFFEIYWNQLPINRSHFTQSVCYKALNRVLSVWNARRSEPKCWNFIYSINEFNCVVKNSSLISDWIACKFLISHKRDCFKWWDHGHKALNASLKFE